MIFPASIVQTVAGRFVFFLFSAETPEFGPRTATRAEKLGELLATKGVDARRVRIGDREAEGEAAVVVSLRAG